MDTLPRAIEAVGLGQDARDARNFVAPAGAIVGLLGPNGAGTTTMMLVFGAAASNACCGCADLADTREPALYRSGEPPLQRHHALLQSVH